MSLELLPRAVGPGWISGRPGPEPSSSHRRGGPFLRGVEPLGSLPAVRDGGDTVKSAASRPGPLPWIVTGLSVLVLGAPLTVNAFGSSYRAAFQVLSLVLGLVVLADARLTSLLWAGPSRRVVGALAALWFYLVVRAPASLDPPAALGAVLDRTALGVVVAVLASGMLGASRRTVIGAGLAGMAVVAAWGIVQRFGIHPFLDPAVWIPSRPTRPLGTHNLMGGYVAAWLPVAAAAAIRARGWTRFASGAAGLLALACFLLSESRGAWAAAGGAALAFVPWLRAGGARLVQAAAGRDRRGLMVLALAALVVGAACAGSVAERLRTRERSGVLAAASTVEAPGASALTSFERRRLLAETALDLVRSRPWWGSGPGSFRLAFYTARPPAMQRLEAETGETAVHAHWDALELAAELGLAGVLFAAVWLALAARSAWRAIDVRRGGEVDLVDVGLVAGGLVLGLHALVDFSLEEVPTALTGAVFLGLVVGREAAPAGAAARPAAPLVRAVLAVVLVAGIGGAVAAGLAEGAYRRAYAVLGRGDLDASERWLERALGLGPDRARDWVALGEVARHRAERAATAPERQAALAQAARRFGRAAALEPQVAARSIRAAAVLDEARQAGVAVAAGEIEAHLERARAANPRAVEASARLAALAREAGDTARAAELLGAAEGLEPGSGRLVLERGRLALAEGDAGRAVAAWVMAAAGAGPAAGAAADELAQLARDGAPQAREAARRALAGLAGRSGPAGTEVARRLGDLALGAGEMEEARRWYSQAARGGSSPELELALGNLAYTGGRLEEAERRYRAALAARPGMAEAVQSLGNIAVTRGDTSRARELYARALALRPGNAALRAYVARLSGAPPP